MKRGETVEALRVVRPCSGRFSCRATPEGKKELVSLTDGVRESKQFWKELLLDLSGLGYPMGPELAVAMARLASGKPSKRYGHILPASAAGCTIGGPWAYGLGSRARLGHFKLE